MVHTDFSVSSYIQIQISMENEKAAKHFAEKFKPLGHQLELFNGICERYDTPKQTKETMLDVHIALLDFYAQVYTFLRRGQICKRRSTRPERLLTMENSGYRARKLVATPSTEI